MFLLFPDLWTILIKVSKGVAVTVFGQFFYKTHLHLFWQSPLLK